MTSAHRCPTWNCGECWKHFYEQEELSNHTCPNHCNLKKDTLEMLRRLQNSVPKQIYTPWDIYFALTSVAEEFRKVNKLPEPNVALAIEKQQQDLEKKKKIMKEFIN